MAEFGTCVVPFPRRPSPLHESERFTLPSEAAAELRATMLGNLLDQIAEPEGFQTEKLRLRMNQLIPQNLDCPRCINRDTHIAVLHAIYLDRDAITKELVQGLLGISARSDGEHNGLADTTSEY